MDFAAGQVGLPFTCLNGQVELLENGIGYVDLQVDFSSGQVKFRVTYLDEQIDGCKFLSYTLNMSPHHGTRMHSSRMRTGRSLTVCWRPLRGEGGGGCLVWGGVCCQGGVWSGGVCSWGGVPGPGGCLLPRGVSAPGGGIPACTEADTPSCGQNHRHL